MATGFAGNLRLGDDAGELLPARIPKQLGQLARAPKLAVLAVMTDGVKRGHAGFFAHATSLLMYTTAADSHVVRRRASERKRQPLLAYLAARIQAQAMRLGFDEHGSAYRRL